MTAAGAGFRTVSYSRIWDKNGNGVTWEGKALGGNTIWGFRVCPPLTQQSGLWLLCGSRRG